jgi:hypothetical protein
MWRRSCGGIAALIVQASGVRGNLRCWFLDQPSVSRWPCCHHSIVFLEVFLIGMGKGMAPSVSPRHVYNSRATLPRVTCPSFPSLAQSLDVALYAHFRSALVYCKLPSKRYSKCQERRSCRLLGTGAVCQRCCVASPFHGARTKHHDRQGSRGFRFGPCENVYQLESVIKKS